LHGGTGFYSLFSRKTFQKPEKGCKPLGFFYFINMPCFVKPYQWSILMNRILSCLFACFMAITLVGCGEEAKKTDVKKPADAKTTTGDKK